MGTPRSGRLGAYGDARATDRIGRDQGRVGERTSILERRRGNTLTRRPRGITGGGLLSPTSWGGDSILIAEGAFGQGVATLSLPAGTRFPGTLTAWVVAEALRLTDKSRADDTRPREVGTLSTSSRREWLLFASRGWAPSDDVSADKSQSLGIRDVLVSMGASLRGRRPTLPHYVQKTSSSARERSEGRLREAGEASVRDQLLDRDEAAGAAVAPKRFSARPKLPHLVRLFDSKGSSCFPNRRRTDPRARHP